MNLTFIPKDIKEDKNGTINISNNSLKNLEGSPNYIKGNLDCSYNVLTSLKGRPISVKGDFNCKVNYLRTLEYSPMFIGGDFDCSNNSLNSLKGRPKEIKGSFICNGNLKIRNLQEQIILFEIVAKNYISDSCKLDKDYILKEISTNKLKQKQKINNHIDYSDLNF